MFFLSNDFIGQKPVESILEEVSEREATNLHRGWQRVSEKSTSSSSSKGKPTVSFSKLRREPDTFGKSLSVSVKRQSYASI